jgi:hypothetical protein
MLRSHPFSILLLLARAGLEQFARRVHLAWKGGWTCSN